MPAIALRILGAILLAAVAPAAPTTGLTVSKPSLDGARPPTVEIPTDVYAGGIQG